MVRRTGRLLPAVGDALIPMLLILGALGSLLPFIWMAAFSFGRPQEFIQLPPPIIPTQLRLDNYVEVFARVPFLSFLMNSLFVTLASVLGQLVICSMAAYAFARLRFPGKGPLFLIFLASFMIPAQVTIVPLFLLMRPLGLIDSIWALILPSLFSVFGVFLLRQYLATIPREITEAGMIDGAGHFRVFAQLILPMASPALASLAILIFNATWNSFLWPLIVINSPENMTIPLGISFLNGQQGAAATGVIMAGVTLSVLPSLIVFLLLQRRLVEGISVGTSIY